MTPGTLIDLADGLARIETALRPLVPGGVSLARSGGAFDASEIRRHVVNAPAVIISCLGADDFARRRTDEWQVDAQFALYLLTRDQPPAPPRDLAALSLTTALLRLIPKRLWDSPEAFGLPDEATLAATNLYSGAIDSVAVALWAITWRQVVHLDSTAPVGL